MFEEILVNNEIAKLLKLKGFKEPCHSCYGLGVFHNGEYIDGDEESELIAEGRKKEIEYIEGSYLYNAWYSNGVDGDGTYAAPTLDMVRKWLREEKQTHIVIKPVFLDGALKYKWECCAGPNLFSEWKGSICDSYEQACEEAISYCVKELI